jgi:hypothetical protein
MKIFEEVRPGDLITAEFMNRVLREIEQLSRRVAEVGTGAPADDRVKVTGVFGARRVGGLLEVRGKNFEVPVHLNVVLIDEVVVPQTHFGTGNTDERLYFIVPDGFDELPREVTLRVVTRSSTDSIRFILSAEEALPVGSLTSALSAISPEHGVIEAGATYDLTFDITGITTLAETYDVEASMDPVGWALDVGGTGTAASTIDIPAAERPGAMRQVKVAVTIPPGTPLETARDLTLKVTSQRNPDLRTDRLVRIAVGAPPPGVQSAVVVAFSGTVTSPGSVSDGEVRIPGTAQQVNVNFRIRLAEGAPSGIYKFFGSVDPSSGWSVTPNATTFGRINLASGSQPPLAIELMAASNAATPTFLTTRLEKEDDSSVAGEDRRKCVRTDG